MENTSNMTAQEELMAYIAHSYTPELQSDLVNACMLFETLSYPGWVMVLNNMLYEESSEDLDLLQISFHNAVSEILKEILLSYGVHLLEDVSIDRMTGIITALETVLRVEDPEPMLRVLETLISPEEKIARIVNEYTVHSVGDILLSIAHIEKSLIDRLLEILGRQEHFKNYGEPEASEAMVDRIKKYFEFAGTDCLGYEMLASNFRIGYPLAIYMSYVSPNIQAVTVEQTAKNIISCFMLSKDATYSILDRYRQYSEEIVQNPTQIAQIETAIQKSLETFEQFMKAKNDKI